jgi:hypothetical protein
MVSHGPVTGTGGGAAGARKGDTLFKEGDRDLENLELKFGCFGMPVEREATAWEV